VTVVMWWNDVAGAGVMRGVPDPACSACLRALDDCFSLAFMYRRKL